MSPVWAQYFDWQASSNVSTGTTQLSFAWNSSLQTNANTAYAAPATTCYCAVTTNSSYTVAYTTTPIQSPSHGSGLSSGAIAAAVIVPVLAVLVLGVLLWHHRSRLSRGGAEKDAGAGRAHGRLDESDADSREVSMADLGLGKSGGGRLASQGW